MQNNNKVRDKGLLLKNHERKIMILILSEKNHYSYYTQKPAAYFCK